MPKNLTAFFSPKSVSIIGASRTPGKVGYVILKNLIDSGFKGEIYPINPSAKTILKKKCYKSISEVPETPDLVVISIPANPAVEVLNEIGEKGVKNIVIISAGFKETGAEGQKLEKQLEEISKKYEINLLGPNCLGFVNNEKLVNATFGKVSSPDGNISFISQSGAIATSIFDWCGSIGLGFSHFVTLGNKTVIDESDVLEYLFQKNHGEVTSLFDEGPRKVNSIGLYLESILDGPRFLEISGKITQYDPVFIIKPGKTPAAATAMQSHTGAIAGADDVLDAAFEEAGIVRCQTLEDFFDLSKAFSWGTIPKGPKVAIISNAGGPAVISSDSIIENGLEIAEFDDETKKKLVDTLPRSASIMNPIDVLGDALADRFASATEIVLQTDECDALVVLLTPQIMTQIEKTAKMVGEISKKYNKPVFCSFIGGSLVSEGEKILNKMHIPSFRFPERAIYAIGAMWKFKKQQEKNLGTQVDIYQVLNFDALPEKISEVIKGALDKKQTALDNIEADLVVSGAGVSTPPTLGATNFEQAVEFAEVQGYPVVLKISSPGLLHKKSVGGVFLNIKDRDDLEDAWDILERKKANLEPEIREKAFFQIQKEVPSGVEVIVGIKTDKTFGPVMLFGAGGSLAELISDKNLCLLPLDTNRAKELVQDSKIYKSLKGKDKESPYALDKLYDLMVRLSNIVNSQPEIQEIEINPVIVGLNDVWAVDTKVVLKEGRQIPAGPNFKTARVLKTEKLTKKMYYFEIESEEPFDVIPGQYISIKVSDTRINCYSVAGHLPPNKFNLLVDISPGGPGSRFFESLKVGDKVRFLGPFGHFVLNLEEDVESMLFVGTGCGTAPLKLMIEKALAEEKSYREVKLYLGINTFDEIFMKDYFDGLSEKYKNFKYEISIKDPDERWKGPTGFVTDLIKKDYPDASKSSAYLCGNKFMVEAVSKVLMDNGCPREKIYTEKYGK